MTKEELLEELKLMMADREAYLYGKYLEANDETWGRLSDECRSAYSQIRALIEGQSIPDNIATAIGASKVVDLRPKVTKEWVEQQWRRWSVTIDTPIGDWLTEVLLKAGVEVIE